MNIFLGKNDSFSTFYLRFDGEMFCISLEEVGERKTKHEKKERRKLFDSYCCWAVALMVWNVIDLSHLLKNIMIRPGAHWEPSQTTKTELLRK